MMTDEQIILYIIIVTDFVYQVIIMVNFWQSYYFIDHTHVELFYPEL